MKIGQRQKGSEKRIVEPEKLIHKSNHKYNLFFSNWLALARRILVNIDIKDYVHPSHYADSFRNKLFHLSPVTIYHHFLFIFTHLPNLIT